MEIIEVLKEARKCIARLTPFPVQDCDGVLLDAINQTADYADEVRDKITKLIEKLEVCNCQCREPGMWHDMGCPMRKLPELKMWRDIR